MTDTPSHSLRRLAALSGALELLSACTIEDAQLHDCTCMAMEACGVAGVASVDSAASRRDALKLAGASKEVELAWSSSSEVWCAYACVDSGATASASEGAQSDRLDTGSPAEADGTDTDEAALSTGQLVLRAEFSSDRQAVMNSGVCRPLDGQSGTLCSWSARSAADGSHGRSVETYVDDLDCDMVVVFNSSEDLDGDRVDDNRLFDWGGGSECIRTSIASASLDGVDVSSAIEVEVISGDGPVPGDGGCLGVLHLDGVLEDVSAGCP